MKLVDDDELAQALKKTHAEAVEVEERCTALADTFDGKKTAILDKARETKQEAVEMMSTYLGEAPDGLDGFEFLTMAEAGELGHWSVVAKMNEKARHPGIQEVADWALPLQKKHLDLALEGSLKLAGEEDPSEPA